MLTITREWEFSYAHHLPEHDGKCHRPHGHNGKLSIEIAGPIQQTGPKTGMILDYADFDTIVKTAALDWMDHYDLNVVCSPVVTTAENLVLFVYRVIAAALEQEHPGIHIIEVKLWETSRNCATYRPGV